MARAVQLLFVGDNVVTDRPGGAAGFYDHVISQLDEADAVFGNLEWPCTDLDDYDPLRFGRSPGHMWPSDADVLRAAGFRVMSLANNHVMDYGAQGLTDTVDALDRAGIMHCGGGADRGRARAPALLEVGGIRVAYLAYTAVFSMPHYPKPVPADQPQMATLRVETAFRPSHRYVEQPGTPPIVVTTPDPAGLAEIQHEIAAARSDADIAVVSWHWGVSEGYRRRVGYQDVVGRACVDAGADLVVGAHPHVLQGVERYRGGTICYSLANFAFFRGRPAGPPNHDPHSVILSASVIDGRVANVEFLSLTFDEGGRPEPADEAHGRVVAAALTDASADLGTRFSYHDGRIRLHG